MKVFGIEPIVARESPVIKAEVARKSIDQTGLGDRPNPVESPEWGNYQAFCQPTVIVQSVPS